MVVVQATGRVLHKEGYGVQRQPGTARLADVRRCCATALAVVVMSLTVRCGSVTDGECVAWHRSFSCCDSCDSSEVELVCPDCDASQIYAQQCPLSSRCAKAWLSTGQAQATCCKGGCDSHQTYCVIGEWAMCDDHDTSVVACGFGTNCRTAWDSAPARLDPSQCKTAFDQP